MHPASVADSNKTTNKLFDFRHTVQYKYDAPHNVVIF